MFSVSPNNDLKPCYPCKLGGFSEALDGEGKRNPKDDRREAALRRATAQARSASKNFAKALLTGSVPATSSAALPPPELALPATELTPDSHAWRAPAMERAACAMSAFLNQDFRSLVPAGYRCHVT